jgi:hypothetical protein
MYVCMYVVCMYVVLAWRGTCECAASWWSVRMCVHVCVRGRQATFYGVLAANRPWLLDGYVSTVSDIIPAALDLAHRQVSSKDSPPPASKINVAVTKQNRACAVSDV